MNVNLNVGGVLGGVLMAAMALFVVFAAGEEMGIRHGRGQLVMLSVFGGAVIGNFLWGCLKRKPIEGEE